MVAMTPGVASVRVDWQSGPQGNHALSVFVDEVGSPDENATLTLVEGPTGNTFEYYDDDTQETHNVTWYADGSGSITVPDHNGALMACWDAQQENAVCP
jgi:hypothetical protein